MQQQALIEKFVKNHQAFLSTTEKLTDAQYLLRAGGKWNAGQQVLHLYLCLQSIASVLTSKSGIQIRFGGIQRTRMDEATVLTTYKKGLERGGVAPERFLPGEIGIVDRSVLYDSLLGMVELVSAQLLHYSERELDNLALPHPFLGLLTLRELFYLMSYHATHHQAQIESTLH